MAPPPPSQSDPEDPFSLSLHPVPCKRWAMEVVVEEEGGVGESEAARSVSIGTSLAQRLKAVVLSSAMRSQATTRQRSTSPRVSRRVRNGVQAEERQGSSGSDNSGDSDQEVGQGCDPLTLGVLGPETWAPEMNVRLPLSPYLTYLDNSDAWCLHKPSWQGLPAEDAARAELLVTLPQARDHLGFEKGPLDDYYCCISCGTQLVKISDLICRSFTGQHGRAWLFTTMVNVSEGPKEQRSLLTGMHTVVDVACLSCKTVVGWRYMAAIDKAQKYKLGKYIVEQRKIIKVPAY